MPNFSDILDPQHPTVSFVKIVLGDEILECFYFFQKIYFLFSSLRDKNAGDFPKSSIDDSGSDDVKCLEGLRIVVLQDGHEFLHSLFRDVVGVSHISAVVYHTELIGF